MTADLICLLSLISFLISFAINYLPVRPTAEFGLIFFILSNNRFGGGYTGAIDD